MQKSIQPMLLLLAFSAAAWPQADTGGGQAKGPQPVPAVEPAKVSQPTPAGGQAKNSQPATGGEQAKVSQPAAGGMEASLARQRASIAKQARTAAGTGYFVLPPPERLGATVAAPAPAATAECDPLPPGEVDALIQKSAKEQDLDPDLLRSVMQQESAFRPCAVSPKGAAGLMQLMPATASQFGVADPFDPASNVNAGAAFLKQLLTRYSGDITQALGAYNAGPGKVDAGTPPVAETKDYIQKVLSSMPKK